MMTDWQNKNVLVIGAARQGLALTRFLLAQGAKVTLNDKRTAVELHAVMEAHAHLSINWQLGHHELSLLKGVDLLCISGGIPLDLPLIQQAVLKGIPLSNDSQIFMQHVPCRVIGITGSAGKTTTTTLVGRMAGHAVKEPRKAWVGGNIGQPLIDVVSQIAAHDLVILEFSSFQLEQMTLSPHISAILNITPNHLDRHGTMEVYAAVKSRIFKYQSSQDWAILGCNDPEAWRLREQVPGRLAAFGLNPLPAGLAGAFIHNDRVTLTDGEQETEVIPTSEIELRGKHNQLNVLAACTIAQAAGMPVEAMQAGIRGFTGVEHRLEYIRTYKGADWYNDSKATTPEGALAAISAFDDPVIVLLGGRDKHLPWHKLAEQVHQRVDHVILFGEAAEKIARAIGSTAQGERPYSIYHCEHLEEAVLAAAALAQPGFVVILAPGGTSFDEFNNYEERGTRFKEWVTRLS